MLDRAMGAAHAALAVAILANGALGMAVVLVTRFPEHPALLRALLPFGVVGLNRSLTLVLSLLLVYLAFEVYERRWAAWWAAAVVMLMGTVLHLERGEWAAGLVGATTGGILFATRHQFTIRSDPRRVVHGGAVAGLTGLVALTYGAAGFWLLERYDFGRAFSPAAALAHSLRELMLVGNPDLVPATPHAAWFVLSLRLLGAVCGVLLVWSLFRPLAYRLRTLSQERAEAEAIVTRHGRVSLDYFKLWPDKSYFFSSDRSAVIAYRTAWSVAVSLGDPVGPDDRLDALVRAFATFCEENGWKPAFHQVLPDLLPVYRDLGFGVLKIGEEAIVDLARFAAETSQHPTFRKPRRRLPAEGYRVVRQAPPHTSALLDEAQEVSGEWLSLPGRRERAFALGHFDRGYLSRGPLVLARDRAGRLVAFLNEIPGIRAGVATVDLMRHRRETPNGLMDYVFGELLLRLREEGYRWFSLGLAPLAGVGDRPGAGLHERAVHQVYEHLTAVFSFKGLRSYKAKFEPVWEERYLAYRDGPAGLLRTALALGRITRP